MPGKNYLTKKTLQHKCREAGLPTSGIREDMLKRLNSQNSDDEYISAENQSLQKKVVELEKTVRELQERSFHPSVISSPIEKSVTVNEVQPANGSYSTSQRHDEKLQQQEIDLRSSEMHVQKLTNVPNVNLATSQSQQNDNYPTQPHNVHFATSQQNDIYPTQLTAKCYPPDSAKHRALFYVTEICRLCYITAKRNHPGHLLKLWKFCNFGKRF